MEELDEEVYDKEDIPLSYSTHELRWCPGTCKICNEHADVHTHYHASLHGYNNVYDYIKDGNVLFDFERKRRVKSESKGKKS